MSPPSRVAEGRPALEPDAAEEARPQTNTFVGTLGHRARPAVARPDRVGPRVVHPVDEHVEARATKHRQALVRLPTD